MYKILLLVVMAFSVLSAGKIIPAAERSELYLSLLKNKRVALVVNHSSLVGKSHLLDHLLKRGIKVQKIFAPEHGFRGKADAGAHIKTAKTDKLDSPLSPFTVNIKNPQKQTLKGSP